MRKIMQKLFNTYQEFFAAYNWTLYLIEHADTNIKFWKNATYEETKQDKQQIGRKIDEWCDFKDKLEIQLHHLCNMHPDFKISVTVSE